MDCLIQVATALCLIQPSGLTLRADISAQVAGDVTHWSGGHNYGGARLGHLGLELPLLTYRGFAINAGYVHESLLETRTDRGEERLYVGMQWRPFR
jgi:hypothetical protein